MGYFYVKIGVQEVIGGGGVVVEVYMIVGVEVDCIVSLVVWFEVEIFGVNLAVNMEVGFGIWDVEEVCIIGGVDMDIIYWSCFGYGQVCGLCFVGYDCCVFE